MGLIRPIFLPMNSVNHRFPSGPAAIAVGLVPVSPLYSVTTPAGVIRPILLALASVNHRFPSGPARSPPGDCPG